VIATCLCLLTRTADGNRREVLLGMKKRGFGAGRIVGPGGHVEPGETPAQAAAREVKEESGLVVNPTDLAELAVVRFRFPARPDWDQAMWVFGTDSWTGDVVASDEIDGQWVPADRLPLPHMWDDARYWMPLLLSGRRLNADITMADNCTTVAEAHLYPVG
jgi:8-oxo-dGTP diphosphatase